MGSVYTFSTTDRTRADSMFPVVVSIDDNQDSVECWIVMPAEPTSEPIQILDGRKSSAPTMSIVGTRKQRRVVDEVGTAVATVSSNGWKSVFRTRWAVTDKDDEFVATFTERRRDTLWRRLARPIPKAFRDGTPDLFGALLAGLFYPIFLMKPRCRLIVDDPAGRALGFIEFASDSKDPRDHFSIHLEADPDTQLGALLLPAAVAAVSVMR